MKKSVYLDIRDRVNSDGPEQGLLELAFHPNFKENGFFYVNYTTEKNTVISRFQIDSTNVNQALAESEMKLLQFEQPYSNHNGGVS